MKIALLTIWHEMNYGAELQAYATVKVLQQLGHQVEMIDIRLSDCHKPNLNGRIGNFVSSLGPAHKKFTDFWVKYIPVTKRYHSPQQIQKDPPKADVYMVGSDQVWNPDITGDFAKLFFLDFGEINVRRISFASSFGTQQWEAAHLTKDVSRLIERFDHIGCREQSGLEILRNTFNLSATLTIDPTLLFDQYPELTGEVIPKQSLVYYPLSEDSELMNYSKNLASRLNLQLVNNKHTSTVLGQITWDRVGIEEWVRNIAESQLVITRSFHGLAFSIIYKKPFAIIANKNNRSTRLKNLLLQLGLENRYYESFQECDEAQPWNKPINYDAVLEKLSLLRKDSFNYITEALR